MPMAVVGNLRDGIGAGECCGLQDFTDGDAAGRTNPFTTDMLMTIIMANAMTSAILVLALR